MEIKAHSDTLTIKFLTTSNYKNNQVIKFKNGTLLSYLVGYNEKREISTDINNIEELYDYLNKILLEKQFPFKQWTLKNFYDVLPKLSTLQYLLDNNSNNKKNFQEDFVNKQIVIEI